MIKKLRRKINLGLAIIRHAKNWPHIFANYFHIINKEYTIFKFRNVETIKLRNPKDKNDTSGLATIFEIFLINNYCPKGMEIKEKDIIIDIGANMGIFSMYASLKAPRGTTYSYEPFQTHYKRILDNIKLNNMDNIYPFNLAVCEQEGEKTLFINSKSSGMHSTVFTENSREETIIQCTTLEKIFKDNKIKQCDFLKIDCEGAEYEIIYTAPKSIFKKIKKIALEFDNIDKERNCFELKKILEKNNFSVKIKGANQHQGILYARKLLD